MMETWRKVLLFSLSCFMAFLIGMSGAPVMVAGGLLVPCACAALMARGFYDADD